MEEKVVIEGVEPEFCSPSFNSASFLRSILSEDSSTLKRASTQRITLNLSRLDLVLSSELSSNSSFLVRDLRCLTSLESEGSSLKESISSLVWATGRTCQGLQDPYLVLAEKYEQLSRLFETANLLRNLLHFLKLVQRLKQQIETNLLDLPLAADTLVEVEALLKKNPGKVTALNLVAKEREALKKYAEIITEKSHDLLKNGAKNGNHADIALGLAALSNLKILTPTLQNLIQNLQTSTSLAIKECFLFNEGGDREPLVISKNALFLRIETLLQKLLLACVQGWNLQRALAINPDLGFVFSPRGVGKKPSSSPETEIVDSIWSNLSRLVEEKLLGTKRSNESIYRLLVEEYPRLLSLFQAFLDNLETHTSVYSPAISEWISKTLLPFETEFLYLSSNFLQDKVEALFKNQTLHYLDIRALGNVITNQLKSVHLSSPGELRLARKITLNVNHSMKFFLAKTKAYLKALFADAPTMNEITQVENLPNPTQNSIAQMYNAVNKLYALIKALVGTKPANWNPNLPLNIQRNLNAQMENLHELRDKMLKEIMQNSLDQILEITESLIMPLFEKEEKVIEKILREGEKENQLALFEKKIKYFYEKVLAPLFDRNTYAFEKAAKNLAEKIMQNFRTKLISEQENWKEKKIKPNQNEIMRTLAGIAQLLKVLQDFAAVERLPTYLQLKELKKELFAQLNAQTENNNNINNKENNNNNTDNNNNNNNNNTENKVPENTEIKEEEEEKKEEQEEEEKKEEEEIEAKIDENNNNNTNNNSTKVL